ncbi:hypothetical protein HQ529_06750, partial [Candidatus Woesearchaeota archaeon]|nr:hypothetical protein [Candidatus Woesearchaeota archaeon]
MKKILFIMLVVLFSTLSYAEETDLVRVMKLYYKDGDVDIIDSILKLGYSPDRNIQPENGYRLEIIALTDETLYEFIFEPPTKIFTDVSDDYGNLSGGIILLDETYFALIIPNFENEKKIKIYNR